MNRRNFFEGSSLSPAERRVLLSVFGAEERRGRRTGAFGPSSAGAGGAVSSSESGLLDRIRAGNAYPWLYPTSDFQSFDKFGSVALPAATANAPIGDGVPANGNTMPWTVPPGFNGFIKTMAIEFVANAGAGFTPGVLPAQLGFVLLVNNVPVPDYGNIIYSPGTIISPTPVAGIPIKEGNLVKLIVVNNTIAATTQFVMARLQGYYYGKHLEPKELAF